MTPTPEQVTRATLLALGYDPDVYDITHVRGRWPGYRIDTLEPRAPVLFLREAKFRARMADPEVQIAFRVHLERLAAN